MKSLIHSYSLFSGIATCFVAYKYKRCFVCKGEDLQVLDLQVFLGFNVKL